MKEETFYILSVCIEHCDDVTFYTDLYRTLDSAKIAMERELNPCRCNFPELESLADMERYIEERDPYTGDGFTMLITEATPR